MRYRQRFDTFIRIYDDIGYITSKSDFSDRVVDASGAVFLRAISRKPKTLEEICIEIAQNFIDVSPADLADDVKDFYSILEQDGFIVSGETEEEIDKKDVRFSYSVLEPKTVKADFTPVIQRATKNTQDFLDEHFKEKPHLMSLQIELSSRCNERCVHCYIPHETKINDIDPTLFYDVLDQCREMGVLGLTLSGGEPMLHKNFCDFLRKAKEYDFSINILSNLTLLNDEIIAEMKENRLCSVQVSLYSMKPEIHDSITQLNGSFYKTRDNILCLIENDIPLQISCPTMKQNKNGFADVLNWSREHKVRAETYFIIMARYDHTSDNLDNRLDLDDVGKIITDIIEFDSNYKEELLKADFSEVESRDISNDYVCGVCINSICMIANGNIYPCAGWQDYVCGNIRETPLKEIWENSPKVQYLRALRKKDFSECTSCADRSFCAMCMVRNANEDPDGNPLHINKHFCRVAALNRKIVLDWKAKVESSQ
ncbi:MAG: PqqD family peptide modification chaperone [Treponema sp.]|jgi:radical SAM protein with 4Fe4S-binding SPASM domain|nr:PqqD family peptide modification chaperone [Treponema sp.]